MKQASTIIHVNQHVLRSNLKGRVDEPMLTCKKSRINTYAHEAEILGPSRFVNGMHKPLSCGARIWLKTDSDVNYSILGTENQRCPSLGKTIIRVNAKAIRENVRRGTNNPALLICQGDQIIEVHELLIHGPAVVRTSNLSFESEGKIWIETMAEVEIVSAKDAKDFDPIEECVLA